MLLEIDSTRVLVVLARIVVLNIQEDSSLLDFLLIRCLVLLLEGIVVDPLCLCCVVSRSFPRNFLLLCFFGV